MLDAAQAELAEKAGELSRVSSEVEDQERELTSAKDQLNNALSKLEEVSGFGLVRHFLLPRGVHRVCDCGNYLGKAWTAIQAVHTTGSCLFKENHKQVQKSI
jgi:hypothetical protein